MQTVSRINAILAAASRYVVASMMIVMLASLAAQVFMRYFFNVALAWSEELSLALFCWVVLLSAAVCVHENRHVRLAHLVSNVPRAMRVWLERLIYGLTALFGLYLATSGWTYFMETSGMTSAAIGFPIAYLYASGPVCGILIVLFAAEHALRGTIPGGDLEKND